MHFRNYDRSQSWPITPEADAFRSRQAASDCVIHPRSRPTETGGKGNDGVAVFVQRVPGAIGYVEQAYAKKINMVYAALKNSTGVVVEPKTETFKAAAAGANWSKSFCQILTDEPGKDSWPVVAATYVLLHTTQERPEQGKETLKFFDWAFKNGDQAAR